MEDTSRQQLADIQQGRVLDSKLMNEFKKRKQIKLEYVYLSSSAATIVLRLPALDGRSALLVGDLLATGLLHFSGRLATNRFSMHVLYSSSCWNDMVAES